MVNQERGYEIDPIIPFKEYECMEIINEKDVFLSENKKTLRDYKNLLKKKDLRADTPRNNHEATLIYELNTILDNIDKVNELKALKKNIAKYNYTTRNYLNFFYTFIDIMKKDVNKDLAAVDDIVIGYIDEIKKIYIKQVNFIYTGLINDADGLFNAILATPKFTKAKTNSYRSQLKNIQLKKNIFDELVVINSDYKYDFCHYNEVITGIKSTLDTL
jgi:hypothetical protein